MLLTHQSLLDGAACLCASILIIQPDNWIPGVPVLDAIICHVWNSQFTYWCAVLMSSEYLLVRRAYV